MRSFAEAEWIPCKWWTKELDYGDAIGVGVTVRHSQGGECLEKRVIVPLSDVGRDKAKAVLTGRKILLEWISALPPLAEVRDSGATLTAPPEAKSISLRRERREPL